MEAESLKEKNCVYSNRGSYRKKKSNLGEGQKKERIRNLKEVAFIQTSVVFAVVLSTHIFP